MPISEKLQSVMDVISQVATLDCDENPWRKIGKPGYPKIKQAVKAVFADELNELKSNKDSKTYFDEIDAAQDLQMKLILIGSAIDFFAKDDAVRYGDRINKLFSKVPDLGAENDIKSSVLILGLNKDSVVTRGTRKDRVGNLEMQAALMRKIMLGIRKGALNNLSPEQRCSDLLEIVNLFNDFRSSEENSKKVFTEISRDFSEVSKDKVLPLFIDVNEVLKNSASEVVSHSSDLMLSVVSVRCRSDLFLINDLVAALPADQEWGREYFQKLRDLAQNLASRSSMDKEGILSSSSSALELSAALAGDHSDFSSSQSNSPKSGLISPISPKPILRRDGATSNTKIASSVTFFDNRSGYDEKQSR